MPTDGALQAVAVELHEQGFAIARNLLPASTIQRARDMAADLVVRFRNGEDAVVSRGVSVARSVRLHPHRNPGVLPGAATEAEPYIIGDLTSLDDRAIHLLSSAALWRGAAACLGCGVDEVVFHLSSLTRKPARIGPALGWHRDAGNAYVSAADDRTVRVLVPLQPMSAANGGTAIVPGSHLSGADVPDAGGMACHPEVLPGSVLFLHARVLHGGGCNRSGSDRDVLVAQFGVAASTIRRTGAAEKLQSCGWGDFRALSCPRARESGKITIADK